MAKCQDVHIGIYIVTNAAIKQNNKISKQTNRISKI